MNHQGEEGWYPKCKVCSGANLGDAVVCENCYKKAKIETAKQIFKELEANIFLDTSKYQRIKNKFLQELEK